MAKSKIVWTRKSFTVTFIAIAVAAIAMLWSRVRELEMSVDSLTRQLQSRSGAFPVGTTNPSRPQNGDKKKIFQLIDSAPADDSKTEVGVPWSVEHGMLLDGAERNAPVENRRPTFIYEPPQVPQELIDLPTEAQSNGETD